MKTSKKGIDLIKSFEGCRLTAYKCPAGVWTIGYGHTAGVKSGQIITQEQADAYLASDLEKYERYVEETGLQLKQNQFDALVSFAYNCGNGNLKTLIRNRSLEQIAEALLLYNKANGKVLSGLTRRRKAERELFIKDSNNSEKQNVSKKTIEEIAKEVIAGLWKSGEERKKMLTEKGYDYEAVRIRVNQILGVYYPTYTGSSVKVDEVLRAIGVPDIYVGNKTKRKPIGKVNGMPNYTGKQNENLAIISLAKKGKLKTP